MTVEIDESLIFKRKTNRGRLLNGEQESNWIFGGICRETGEAFLVRVQDRSARTLLAAIRENIMPGTRVISDCWRSYQGLYDSEYPQLKSTIATTSFTPTTLQ